MNGRDAFQFWSIPCGTWFQTQVRLSLFLLPILLLMFFKLGWRIGLAFSVVMLVTVVLHEFGHIFTARLTGGSGNEILVWPLGGLAYAQPADTFRSQFLTPAAGPLVNLALCGASCWWVWQEDPKNFQACLYPLGVPEVTLDTTNASVLLANLMVIIFTLNWKLFLVNLLPVFPLDGGRMLQACLRTRIGSEGALELSLRVGYFAAGGAMLVGLFIDSTWLVFLGSTLFLLNLMEALQSRSADGYDDSFMGYDFSQGYTSLERNREARPTRRPGFFESWRARRRAEKQRRAQLLAEQEQQLIDVLLEKVHQQGIESLTDAERRKLERASAKLRDKGKPGQ
jgi:Zn-dependent protease